MKKGLKVTNKKPADEGRYFVVLASEGLRARSPNKAFAYQARTKSSKSRMPVNFKTLSFLYSSSRSGFAISIVSMPIAPPVMRITSLSIFRSSLLDALK